MFLAVNFTAAFAQKPDGKEILLRIDKNMSAETRDLYLKNDNSWKKKRQDR